jgi:hypothetical protein
MGSANVCKDKVVFFGGYSGRAVDFYDELNVVRFQVERNGDFCRSLNILKKSNML